MRRKTAVFNFLMLTLSVILMTSCFSGRAILENTESIAPMPGNLDLPRYWRYETGYSLTGDPGILDSDEYGTMTMETDRSSFSLGNEKIENPKIKAVIADSYEFFLLNYKISSDQLGIPKGNITIYTVTDSKGFLARLFVIDKEKIACERNGKLYIFSATDKEKYDLLSGDKEIKSGDPREDSTANGVMLGLRSEREVTDGVPGEAVYRTIWISLDKNGLMDLYEIPGILFPRDVFYKMEVVREENIDVIKEYVKVTDRSGKQTVVESDQVPSKSRFVDIEFVSNDFFSYSERISKDKSDGPFQYFGTKRIGGKNLNQKISVSDLFGEEGKRSALSDASTEAEGNSWNLDDVAGDYSDTSFILRRDIGRWEYFGRLNSLKKPDDFLTYKLHFADTMNLYRYDQLTPRWSEIKLKVPGATDAVSSPNDFFTVVKTRNRLILFRKENGLISEKPFAIVDLGRNETVMMHEWARGNYVSEWGMVARTMGKPLEAEDLQSDTERQTP